MENNFYYTVDFSGNAIQIPDLYLGIALAADISFMKYLSTFLPTDDRHEFVKMAVNAKFIELIQETVSDPD